MLKPIRPAATIRIRYEQRLTALVDEMQNSIVHWLAAEWRRNEPETVMTAMDDASPVSALQAAINRLSRHWLGRFDELAAGMADYFATSIRSRCDKSLMADLRKGGFASGRLSRPPPVGSFAVGLACHRPFG